MSMNEFVKYLNGLHNYNAQNQNAYGEKNKQSKYYDRMQVTVDVSERIVNLLEKELPSYYYPDWACGRW